MKVSMDLVSDERVLEGVDLLVREFFATLPHEEEAQYWFGLAIREVVVNAIIHGNKNRNDKRVHLTLEGDASSVKATILDEGEGDEVPPIPDITLDANLLKPHGRGLYLAQKAVDDFIIRRHENRGLEVTLIKRLSQGGNHEDQFNRTG